MARASRGEGLTGVCLGIAPPGSRSDTEMCLSRLSATGGVDFEVVCVFQSEKKKKKSLSQGIRSSVRFGPSGYLLALSRRIDGLSLPSRR